MKDLPTKEQLDFLQNARMDSDRMIMGVFLVAIIAAIWIIVLGTGIENRLVDGFLGATVTAFILIVQFYHRASGHKK